jgi:hypothetical protein
MAIKAAPGERYTVRRQVFKILGGGFDVYDASGVPVGYCRQRALRLKEDLRVFTDRSQQTELFRITARQVIDFGATYDVRLPSGDLIGSLRRKGMKSIIRDEWLVLNPSGVQVATLLEDSGWLAFARRFIDLVSLISPQKFSLTTAGGAHVASFRQHFNPFVYRLGIGIHADDEVIDDLMVLAAGCLVAAIEGRQN